MINVEVLRKIEASKFILTIRKIFLGRIMKKESLDDLTLTWYIKTKSRGKRVTYLTYLCEWMAEGLQRKMVKCQTTKDRKFSSTSWKLLSQKRRTCYRVIIKKIFFFWIFDKTLQSLVHNVDYLCFLLTFRNHPKVFFASFLSLLST